MTHLKICRPGERGAIARLLLALAGYLLPGVQLAAAAPAEWQAGVASVIINPDLPMWMSGYGNRPGPAREIALDLKAKAIALQHAAGDRLVIVTTDLLGIPRVLRETVGREAERRFNLPSHALVINASHTHCGPELRAVETSLSRADAARAGQVERYQTELAARLVGVIGDALARLAPAQLAYGHARAGFAMNRRANYALPANDPRRGKVPNPDGPVDHAVPVLRITSEDNRVRALLFGYACHNTTSNDVIFHGDYAGFAQQEIEARFAGATALFLSGCGGDQNPYPRHGSGRSGVALAKLHGQTLALAVEAALAAPTSAVTGPLRVALENVDLPYLPAPSRAELESRLASDIRATREYAQVLLEVLERDGKLPASYPYPVQVARFGASLTLVALASEVVVDLSLRLKRELGGGAVWVSAYNNDFMGYIPSRRVHQEGGYEGGGALTYYAQTLYRALHPNVWDPVVEDRVISKVLELERRLRQPTR